MLGSIAAEGSGLIAGTLIHTQEGLVPIEQVKVGDLVLSQPEASGERAYKRVVNTFAFEEKEIWVVKIRNWDRNDFSRDAEVNHLYCTGNHPFWVEGIGWTAAEHLRDGQRLRLADDSIASVIIIWPVLRTPLPGVGWVPADTLGTVDGLEEAHIVDFRNGCNLWQYPMWRRQEAGVPYAASLISSKIDQVFSGIEMCNIFEGDDRYFKTSVYNLEIEDHHTYYVGQLGVWVHNQNCHSPEFLNIESFSRSARERCPGRSSPRDGLSTAKSSRANGQNLLAEPSNTHPQTLHTSLPTANLRRPQPGRLPAISRGLSEAIPPAIERMSHTDPGRVAATAERNRATRSSFTATPPGSNFDLLPTGGIACAQPPASGLNPSGVPRSLPQILEKYACLALGAAPQSFPHSAWDRCPRSLCVPRVFADQRINDKA